MEDEEADPAIGTIKQWVRENFSGAYLKGKLVEQCAVPVCQR